MTALRAALIAIVLGVLSCGGEGGSSGGLVLIVIDTLRGDRLGCSGYPPARTPNLDALAAGGTRFADAMTPVPVTLPAVTSLLTGRLPLAHGVRDNDRFVLDPAEETLAERFQAAGWRTGAVLGSAVLSSDRGLAQGFETYDDAFSGPYPVYNQKFAQSDRGFGSNRRRATVVTERARTLLERFGSDRFFLLVHYFDVHTNYDPPPEHGRHHPGRPYDGEISYVDAEIGRLLAALERTRKDATVIVVSDHGEGLGEHGETLHGFLLYQSTLHVPVIASGPGIPGGLVREDPVSLVDLEPTLAAWFDLPAVTTPRDGRTLDWRVPEENEAPLYAETMRTLLSYGWSELRGLRRGRWKLIQGPTSQTYDILEDPGETRAVAGAAAELLAAELKALMGEETRADVLASAKSDVDPERKELLESLGYVAGSPGDAGDYPHPRDALPRWVDRQRAKDFLRIGVGHIVAGRFEVGGAYMDSVLARDPNNAEALYTRGRARLESGDGDGISDIERCLELDTDNVPALSFLAARAENVGDATGALRLWRAVLEADLPANFNPLEIVARSEGSPRELQGEVEALRLKTVGRPDDAEASLALGLALLRLGRGAEGREELRRFVQLTPGRAEYTAVRRVLVERLR